VYAETPSAEAEICTASPKPAPLHTRAITPVEETQELEAMALFDSVADNDGSKWPKFAPEIVSVLQAVKRKLGDELVDMMQRSCEKASLVLVLVAAMLTTVLKILLVPRAARHDIEESDLHMLASQLEPPFRANNENATVRNPAPRNPEPCTAVLKLTGPLLSCNELTITKSNDTA